MVKQELHQGWTMQQVGNARTPLPACVPGSVYYDLMNNGVMEDPYYRDNELAALKLMDHDYEYETLFSPSQELFSQEKILLVFEGIDTLADIFLNGERIASVDNMHRTWEFSVKEYLRKEDNQLRLVFHSPTKFIKEEDQKETLPGSSDAMQGFPHLRKAHCMFGWDWGPRLPDAGIWRAVNLVGYSDARIDGVYITQQHADGEVALHFQIGIERIGQELIRRVSDEKGLEGLRTEVVITDPSGIQSTYRQEEVVEGITIRHPQLWWPNGYGEQPLYTVSVKLIAQTKETPEGTVLDCWEKKIGLRTLTMHREKDAYGESFCHEINGVQIFAMGADYIPEDNILHNRSRERTRALLQDARAAHYNCIRVWGGGFYPDDDFYEICDELGLLVWQDFMFACAVYRLTEAFEESITAEFVDNIKRIRNHACLGLWCGNNEMEMFVDQGMWVNSPVRKSDYVKMYEYIIPKVLKEYDPETFYWPASPSSGGAFDEPNSENRGDVHYWDVWHGNKPITEYRKFYFRYVSEFGFQSFPCEKTCESFTKPEDRNIFSYVMEKHQRNAAANGKIMNYMEQTFLYPSDFGTTLYASQLLQAEAIRYGVEHFRRNRGRCMGAVVWQLNDCWPVASWSSIDYYGRWKALHYYEKRFFAPLMLSCAEEGILTQDTNPNAEPYEVQKSIHLSVANETRSEEQVLVTWELRDAHGEVIRGGEASVYVPALQSVWLPKEDMMDASLYEHYVSYACHQGEATISEGTVLFCAPKQFYFQDPKLQVSVDGDTIVIRAEAYARSVEVQNEEEDLVLSDNYFDMNAGEKRVKILKGTPENLRVRSVYDIR